MSAPKSLRLPVCGNQRSSHCQDAGEREVRHVAWRDMDFRNSLVRVTAKPLWGFGPKNWEERAVPLPTALVEQLQKLRERRNGLPSQLVFPNSKGNPDSENDMIVKRVAQRTKLNCGQCVTKHGNKCAQGPHCRHFFLHKFRGSESFGEGFGMKEHLRLPSEHSVRHSPDHIRWP
jgi:hypothetical protein